MEAKTRIYVKGLACYQRATAAQKANKLIRPEQCFDLSKLPTQGLQKEFGTFILFRGQHLALGSIRSEFWPYHQLCRFFCACYPNMESLLEEEKEDLLRELKKWMLQNGCSVTKTQYRKEYDARKRSRAEAILYLERIYKYLLPEEQCPETEKDIWHLEQLGFPLKENSAWNCLTLNFSGIKQNGMRQEVKKACEVTLRYLAVRTIQQQIRAVKRLSHFLARNYPDTLSFRMFDREQLEDYLVYINTEVEGKKSFRSELQSLKSILDTIGRIYDWRQLCQIFLSGDIPTRGECPAYRAYSDRELQCLNRAIVNMDEQVARALFLHQMLGNRISDTLLLKTDCLIERGGNWMVRVYQAKTQRTCYKPAHEEIIQLIQKSIAYTKDRYGETEYIFVYDKDPKTPMRYGKIQYQLMAMIREEDLRDDRGELFGVGTHTFRRSYGKRLTEMHVDDHTIAKLLGHSNTNTVQRYRKFGDRALAEETRETRAAMDEVLAQITKEWE